MLLNQLSPNDPVSQQALKGLLETAPILNQLQFFASKKDAERIRRARTGTAKTKITRSLNEDNTATAPTPAYDLATKTIVSFDAKVDVQLEDRLEPGEIASELAHQTYLEARQAGYELQNLVFNGDSGDDSEDFDGMANIANASYIKTDGVVLPLGGDDALQSQQEAMEKLLEHIEFAEGASDMYVNKSVRWRLVSIAKRLGYYSQSIDELGKPIPQIMGVNIWSAADGPGGSALLPFTETVGGNDNCSRFYIVKWGEGVDLTALTTVGCKGRYAGQSGNYYTNNVNMDMVLHLQNYASLVISKGWRLSAA